MSRSQVGNSNIEVFDIRRQTNISGNSNIQDMNGNEINGTFYQPELNEVTKIMITYGHLKQVLKKTKEFEN